ncbi:putative helicase [Sinomonas atrocyanea]|uniref:type ISP restriction/modification enzyme n=1 Tax=Sinomonas atrocyanea TaxID=37927 RepID=UPI0027802ACD|nr:type ISP restriction/modification enzyme [Sinomonas atrocyanea]MDQ0261030.1 putative helicase [Sinomonas atrocyanea]
MGSTDFASVFDQLYYSATDERDKGAKFERLVKRYLELKPKYADQFSDVWLWSDWPGRNGHVDTGIDLVARDRYTGELTGIQAKFYDPARQLDKKHIDSFFTAVGKVDFAHGMVVTTTDHWSKHAEEALEDQSKDMQRIRLQDFADSTIDWSAFDVDRPEEMRKSPAKQPRKYQRELNERQYRLRSIFPRKGSHNLGFYANVGGTNIPFCTLAITTIPDLNFYSQGGQFFPRYTYSTPAPGEADLLSGLSPSSEGPERIDNITDAALADYRAAYGAEVTKDDIFFYVYGLLHSPEYRERFAADLKKMLPRIPNVPSVGRFRQFAEAGRRLSELHIGYEDVEPFPLTEVETGLGLETDAYVKYAVTKMRYGGKSGAWDKTRVVYNGHITLEGIPEDAHRYMLGSRSTIDWILERYQIKTDKASGIVNDPNDWSREHHQPRYIIDLLKKIVTVSVETNRIVDRLPAMASIRVEPRQR